MMWATANKPIKIALLDDHAVVRHGLAARLSEEAAFQVVGIYAASRALLQASESITVDVFVIDYALGERDIDGLNLIRALNVRFPNGKVLVSSAHYNPATVALALRAGAKGFVGKEQELSALVEAIQIVMQGKTYLSPVMTAELSSIATTSPREGGEMCLNKSMLAKHGELSPREREVLRCCLDGMTVTQIAAKFARSVKTISGQKQSAFRKLGIRSDSELFKIQHQLSHLAST
jgi:two-component system capsular synthesis response regulator RcsB